MNRNQYRIALASSLAAGFCAIALEMAFPTLLSEQMRKANELEADAAPTWQLLSVGVSGGISVVWSLASAYGLYRFRSWAPRSALAASALGLLAVSLTGSFAQSGVSSACSMLATYLWGICILLPFIEPYRVWFAGALD